VVPDPTTGNGHPYPFAHTPYLPSPMPPRPSAAIQYTPIPTPYLTIPKDLPIPRSGPAPVPPASPQLRRWWQIVFNRWKVGPCGPENFTRYPLQYAKVAKYFSTIPINTQPIHFKHQSLTRACNRGCERRARVQDTYVAGLPGILALNPPNLPNLPSRSLQSRVQRAPNRSRDAHTTTSHYTFDVYRRYRSGNARVKFYDPRNLRNHGHRQGPERG
jgi:hypothetical protein